MDLPLATTVTCSQAWCSEALTGKWREGRGGGSRETEIEDGHTVDKERGNEAGNMKRTVMIDGGRESHAACLISPRGLAV